MAGLIQRLNGHFAGRLVTTALVISGTMVIYWFLNDHLAPRFDFYTRLDAALPFWPWTLPIYFSFYPMLLVAAWLSEAPEFTRLFVSLLVANFACYLGFILLTAHYPRPPLEQISAAWRPFYAVMYGSDGPGNTFPSIHVASTVIVAQRLARQHWVWLLWALAISISTLTVKQHFVVDVLGGALLGLLANAFAFRRQTQEAILGR